MADVVNYNIIIVPDEGWEVELPAKDDKYVDNDNDQNTIDELWEEMHNLKTKLFELDIKLSNILDNELKKG